MRLHCWQARKTKHKGGDMIHHSNLSPEEARYLKWRPARPARAAQDDLPNDLPILRGYAALFDTLSEDMGGWYEEILPGAFEKTLRADDIRALWQHNVNYVLGRMSNGTLTLREDLTGLEFTIRPPDASWARDVVEVIRRGDVSQMSFTFSATRDQWMVRNGLTIRQIWDARLFDVSPVTWPAYHDTWLKLTTRRNLVRHLRFDLERM
jgi:HK97 family phage prohead protease